MRLAVHDRGTSLVIDVDGHITGIGEVNEIKSVIEMNQDVPLIELDLHDALVVPSALIGLLFKKAQKEGKKVVLKAQHEEIQELIQDLDLQHHIEVRVENE